jgi:hypothetical protein
MTYEEEAKRLIDVFALLQDCYGISLGRGFAKQCAKIVIDEKLNDSCINQYENEIDYLKNVKLEIDNL